MAECSPSTPKSWVPQLAPHILDVMVQSCNASTPQTGFLLNRLELWGCQPEGAILLNPGQGKRIQVFATMSGGRLGPFLYSLSDRLVTVPPTAPHPGLEIQVLALLYQEPKGIVKIASHPRSTFSGKLSLPHPPPAVPTQVSTP